ncbi:hypothetical protein CORC01_11195 [Colletotrichum orchidophilum]|uniref:Uncharacterized protein n=1 Tax=Colletotrichum orchidophilum TaxID=1209926 RepID=A0A1G4AWH2_9PEZI|nr:uncharacterized protein CORC01_11195 [Colletotrichum orchidophilum]OHE93509.1 hypothetical protein CORC01_11195 [Colletotrichum orchidophilum]
MTGQNYIDQTSMHPDGLSDPMPSRRTSVAQPPTTIYPDLRSPPFAVTTFNHQAQLGESHMLTPVSGGGSPCVQQPTTLPQYPSAMTPMQPQSSPSGPSRMAWHNTVSMSAPQSQVGSPMAMNPTTSESHFEMNYIQAEPEHEREPPEDYYFGNYTVSAPSESEQGSISPQMSPAYYMSQPPQQMMQPHPIMNELSMSQIPNPSQAQAQYYAQPPANTWVEESDITAFKSEATRRRNWGYALPSTQIQRPEVVQRTNRTRQNNPQAAGRCQRTPRVRARAEQPETESSEEPIAGDEIHHIDLLPDDFVIKAECPQELHFLFERQREMIVQGVKGSGMWDLISNEHKERFEHASTAARLQMQVTRGRSNFLEWSPRDKHILKDAFDFVDAQYFKMVHRKWKEYGGGQTTAWGSSDVEYLAVDRGMVDSGYTPLPTSQQGKSRRGKKMLTRLRNIATSSAVLLDETAESTSPQNPDMRQQIIDEIYEYRGEDPEDGFDEDIIFNRAPRTRPRGRQVEIKMEEESPEETTASSNKARGKQPAKKRTPAKPRAVRGRIAPKPKLS